MEVLASYSGKWCRTPVGKMCRHDSRVHLSAEEAIAAEESLSIYCKPVELYNILQRRALRNPSFLQRCLLYKIQAKHKRRILMTVSIAGNENDGVQMQNLLPLYVLLVRPISDGAVAGHSAVYRINRACVLTTASEFDERDLKEANFVLPEINKLSSDARAGKLTLLLVSCGDTKNLLCGGGIHKDRLDMASFPSNVGRYSLWGKIPIESLYMSWAKCGNLSSGHRAEMLSSFDMHSCFLEPGCLEEGNSISLKIPHNSEIMDSLQKVQVNISAQEVGAAERSPYNLYTYNDIPTLSISHIMRLRAGNVIFNYRYYNNTLQKTEVTEDYSCAFCLVKCANFKGLRCHLCSSHDLFNFEFWVTEEYQAVNVSVKTDIWRSEIVADGVDPRLQTFFFCSRPRKRRRLTNVVQNAKHVHPQVLKSDSPEVTRDGLCERVTEKDGCTSPYPMPTVTSRVAEPSNQKILKRYEKDAHSNKEEKEMAHRAVLIENTLQNENHKAESNGPESLCAADSIERVASSPNITGVSIATAQSSVGPECVQTVSGSSHAPSACLQFAKTRKLSVERADPKNRTLLQKRPFFHSHRAQPMELDQVLSDRDSEDEVDDDIADLEDIRMLDDFVDVTKDEKQIMHLWNSFVRKQRVLADGHIPWACEAFSRLHGQDLIRAPALIWCWRLFMIKLWNHNLLDGRTMNNCNLIIERYQTEGSNPKQI
ncbi:polycomb group protein EMF2B-like isoform X1 [Telopea speciosissima]|uniref:polycomb group protein EMF2B-like isoform X1 n=1 Tax=Telopea speciosissima TaxID=54955 RepID=UPI001CC5B8EB|nr:polycomb group protein EMF2B-like isoform X1 [Telopea speciosissima]